jgi:hypothetical protein
MCIPGVYLRISLQDDGIVGWTCFRCSYDSCRGVPLEADMISGMPIMHRGHLEGVLGKSLHIFWLGFGSMLGIDPVPSLPSLGPSCCCNLFSCGSQSSKAIPEASFCSIVELSPCCQSFVNLPHSVLSRAIAMPQQPRDVWICCRADNCAAIRSTPLRCPACGHGRCSYCSPPPPDAASKAPDPPLDNPMIRLSSEDSSSVEQPAEAGSQP